jgi:cobaltochelatase CobS
VAGGGGSPTPKGERPAPTDPVAIPDGIVAHESLRDILDVLEVSDRGAMLVGPAGTGKSFIAAQCAEILGLPFYALSCGQIPQDYKIEGYPTKDGYFVTDFLTAFEHGGIWCADEIDNSHPATLVTLNTAISNGFVFAGGKRYDRHPDFRIVATANTFGTGPDAQYVGRSPLDFATLDRFRKVTVGYDENVERHQCETKAARFGVGRAELERWIDCWSRIRYNIENADIPVSATSRGLVDGVALISKGWSVGKIVKSEFGGLTPSIFERITFGTEVEV